MPRLILLAAWTLLPGIVALAENAPDPNLDPSPSVAVFLDFDSTPGNSSLEIMKREVDGLLKPSGIHLDWKLVRDNDGRHAFPGLVVMKFKGRCRAENGSEPSREFGSLGETFALGSTQVANGHVLPYSEIECDQVRKALAYLHPGADQLERQHALGLALGRVVAHELYHILARTTEHAAQGLARASQSLRDLVNPEELGFLDADEDAIRKGGRAD